MKQVFILLLLAITCQMNAQTTMEKLAAMSVDEDPLFEKNDAGTPIALRGDGLIFLKKKQKKVEGKVRILFSYDDPKKAARYGVTPEGSMKEKIYSMKAVEYAEIEGRKFETSYVGLSVMTKMVILERIDDKLGDVKLYRRYSLYKTATSTGGMSMGNPYSVSIDHYILNQALKKTEQRIYQDSVSSQVLIRLSPKRSKIVPNLQKR